MTLRLVTFVASCAVLDTRLSSHLAVLRILGAVALSSWLVLIVLTVRNMSAHGWVALRDHAHGAWELASVGSSGLAIVMAQVAYYTGGCGGRWCSRSACTRWPPARRRASFICGGCRRFRWCSSGRDRGVADCGPRGAAAVRAHAGAANVIELGDDAAPVSGPPERDARRPQLETSQPVDNLRILLSPGADRVGADGGQPAQRPVGQSPQRQ